MEVFKIILANIYIIMSKISKKRNRADSAESHEEETVAKRGNLKNSNGKQGGDKFLNQCQKKFKNDFKIYTRKGELYFYNNFVLIHTLYSC